MRLALGVATVFLAAIALSLSLAHALELPGKLRLDKSAYLAVQQIYYPGFTLGGVGEGLSMPAALALLVVTPAGTTRFWWTLAGFVALVAMHAAYWILTHPVNKFWLRDTELGGAGARFFTIGSRGPSGAASWLALRDRWEYSHVVRAALAAAGLVALTVSIAM